MIPKEGDAVLILNGDQEPALFGDGECELRFQKDVGMGEDVVGLTMVNGGGFACMLIPRECWPELRTKIDKLMEKPSGKSPEEK